MFGLFRRKKIESWEIELLGKIFGKNPEKFDVKFHQQIVSGLFTGVHIGLSDIPNYIGFKYDPKLYERFYRAKGRNYKFSNILIRDLFTNEYLPVSIYVSSGVINGYSIDKNISKHKLDSSDINVRLMHKIFIGEDNSNVLSLLTADERDLIIESDIYPTLLDNRAYYHLKELEDGDFIGIDEQNNLYKITHDPFEINMIDRNLLIDLLEGKLDLY
ncbi:hypothetical protein R1T16_13875 [Flavobacterium sp. DG1-102-2]|uniref:hypothetical protein n=1 Tax=Flavobacterium sp. DG1-102-2 TaxID=3081663 RepID=UPI00294A5A2E|nr:hypothetical protein [Flavobacterium sp. DG1-102-2]MDV6169519.1 hypothetical protein [Flavobacterium sp. DG1-102-2]